MADIAHEAEIAGIAHEAEIAGWDGFFLWDHLMIRKNTPFCDPWISLAAIAMKTSKIKIGTMVTPLPRRRPWQLAREIVSLDHLSNGRVILGVGIGDPPSEFSTFGDEKNAFIRGKMLDEGLEILRGLWSGSPFKYEGEYFKIRKVKFLPKPVNNHIPIWIAGLWPNKKPFLRASKYDGVCPNSVRYPDILSPKELKEAMSYIKQNRNKTNNYDVYFAGDTPEDKYQASKVVEKYKEAGATWWSENINYIRFDNSPKKMLERIRKGPPKID
ncbi:MAG: LLM class flavin-dependent oxidoreductase [Candidatus Lokiarchaeota archaeon]|nr:LLM class flavin-dependent oxidoreductase [Candidatus Lokiarchaeota archaeon]